MRVLLSTIGSRGNVQPLVMLALQVCDRLVICHCSWPFRRSPSREFVQMIVTPIRASPIRSGHGDFAPVY